MRSGVEGRAQSNFTIPRRMKSLGEVLGKISFLITAIELVASVTHSYTHPTTLSEPMTILIRTTNQPTNNESGFIPVYFTVYSLLKTKISIC